MYICQSDKFERYWTYSFIEECQIFRYVNDNAKIDVYRRMFERDDKSENVVLQMFIAQHYIKNNKVFQFRQQFLKLRICKGIAY